MPHSHTTQSNLSQLNLSQYTSDRLVAELKVLQTLPYQNWLSMLGRSKVFEAIHAELDRRNYNGPRPGRQLRRLTAERLAEALYVVDPMNTSCKENDCPDEYARIARQVMAQVYGDDPFHLVLADVLSRNFGFAERELPDLQAVIDHLADVRVSSRVSESTG
ncbi:MAG: hypothetical protein JJU10_00305 [Idiomarina sp.]|nr:hypothetical protein [Idiomarina sp.]